MLTAEEILSAKKCGDIFRRGSKEDITLEYRQLAKRFHPDLHKGSASYDVCVAVMAKLNEFRDCAFSMIERGLWEESNIIEIRDTHGKRYRGRYLKSVPFELGVSYIGANTVTYLFDPKYEQFFSNAVQQISGLRYADKEMEKEISRYMPHILYHFKTPEDKYCLIIKKPQDVFMLSDVQRVFGGKLPDRHVAWIISRLNNLCCYFSYHGIAHNGLTLNTCFISPSYHMILPLGGWWYATKIGERMIGTSKVVYDVMPVKVKSTKLSSITTDLEASKLIGRQLIDPGSVPKQILDYLNEGSSSKATAEFSKWNSTLDSAYGKRQFVEMKISESEIYQ